jgi:hypothetical protein
VSDTQTTALELVLVNGERRSLTLETHTGSIGNVLDRFDDWIQTDDGGWVQKSFVIEVRPKRAPDEGRGTLGPT